MCMTSSSKQRKKEKAKRTNERIVNRPVGESCSTRTQVCFLFPTFRGFVSNFQHFAVEAGWRKWRDSALRHREGHILEANAARVQFSQCAARKFPQHERCRRAARERPLRAVMLHPTPKTPWSHRRKRPAVVFLDGKQWCCMTCLEINSGKSRTSALPQLLEAGEQQRSDLNLLCQRVKRVSRSSFSDEKRGCAQLKRDKGSRKCKLVFLLQRDLCLSSTQVSPWQVMPELNVCHKVPVASLRF